MNTQGQIEQRIEQRRAQVKREIERRTANIEKVADALRDTISNLGELDAWQQEACGAAMAALYDYLTEATRDDGVRFVELDNQLRMIGAQAGEQEGATE